LTNPCNQAYNTIKEGEGMQIAATIRYCEQISPEGHIQMCAKTYVFSDKDTIEYMLKATGMKDVSFMNLSNVATDEEYKV
jgi:hypothetical protein